MMSFDPKIWGRHAWFFINTIIMSLPQDVPHRTQVALHNFFSSLHELIPCESCRGHYMEFYNNEALDSSSRDTVWIWLTNLHNQVNQRNGTSQMSPELAAITHRRHFSGNTQIKKYGLLFITVALIVVSALIWRGQSSMRASLVIVD